jgi:hypothetical protein
MISMRKSAGIGINQKSLEKFFEDAEAAEMYYDEETNEVGIKPIEENSESTHYTLTRSESGGSITPQAFFNTHDLIPTTDEGEPVTKRYEPYWNGNNQLVMIDLDEPIVTYGSPGTKESEESEAEEPSAEA